MSCYECLAKFSFFTKEHSCGNCELSFCSKCLQNKATVGEEQKNVCKNCYKKLTSGSEVTSTPEMETPGSLLERLETLENPAKPPITIFRHSNKFNNLKYGLSSEDKKIVERLEKLKADHKTSILPDESEIKRRLALLQDKSEESIKEKPQFLSSPSKTQQEQVDELLNQYLEETGLETSEEMEGNQKIKNIESRLKNLQMSETSTMPLDSSIMASEDGDSITAKMIKRAIAEGKLERKLKESVAKEDDSDISDMDQSDEEPSLPWCCICNEDATIKCIGCDNSLYCQTCFRQGHEYFDMENHEHIPYVKK